MGGGEKGKEESEKREEEEEEEEQRGEDGYSCETVASSLSDEQEVARRHSFVFSSCLSQTARLVSPCGQTLRTLHPHTFYLGIKECLLIFRFCKLTLSFPGEKKISAASQTAAHLL